MQSLLWSSSKLSQKHLPSSFLQTVMNLYGTHLTSSCSDMEQLTIEAVDLSPLFRPGLTLPQLPLLKGKVLLPGEGGLQILQSWEQVCTSARRDMVFLSCSAPTWTCHSIGRRQCPQDTVVGSSLGICLRKLTCRRDADNPI